MTGRPSVQVRVTTAMPAITGTRREAEPCALVIFGAGGDLTRRKLMPALYHLRADGVLPAKMAVIGVAREALDTASFRAGMLKGVTEFGGGTPDARTWLSLEQQLFYVQGELNDPGTYARLKSALESCALPEGSGHLFYLAIPPQLYAATIAQLSLSGVAPRTSGPDHKPYRRVLIEKPFGTSLESARALNREVQAAFSERQIYRLDHYLGKETVQNLLMFRFANSIFEPVWNRQHVHHVQITAAESVGVEHRGGYYEQAGVVRDMFQNHLLQLLTLAAMEPPVTFSADAVRDEKVKVLRALRSPSADEMHEYVVRGQYEGYRQEPGVSPTSGTSTYAAVRFMVDNWRWQGVPFYLRSGKRLARRTTEIAIQFRQPPHLMFPLADGEEIAPNVLAISVQPEEKIGISFEVKTPGPGMRPASVLMDFGYDEAFGSLSHDAYETLLLDAMLGDATRFTRSDEVEAAWSAVDPIIEYWAHKNPDHFPNYKAGSWGPEIANEFISRMGARWRE